MRGVDYNVVGWFEIPVTNMERAKKFYETVLDITISVHDLDGFIMGWFPNAPNKSGATGSLVQHKMYTASPTHGPLVYFSSENVDIELARVEGASGTILKGKTEIGDGHGFMALIKDTENNRIALHSRS